MPSMAETQVEQPIEKICPKENTTFKVKGLDQSFTMDVCSCSRESLPEGYKKIDDKTVEINMTGVSLDSITRYTLDILKDSCKEQPKRTTPKRIRSKNESTPRNKRMKRGQKNQLMHCKNEWDMVKVKQNFSAAGMPSANTGNFMKNLQRVEQNQAMENHSEYKNLIEDVSTAVINGTVPFLTDKGNLTAWTLSGGLARVNKTARETVILDLYVNKTKLFWELVAKYQHTHAQELYVVEKKTYPSAVFPTYEPPTVTITQNDRSTAIILPKWADTFFNTPKVEVGSDISMDSAVTLFNRFFYKRFPGEVLQYDLEAELSIIMDIVTAKAMKPVVVKALIERLFLLFFFFLYSFFFFFVSLLIFFFFLLGSFLKKKTRPIKSIALSSYTSRSSLIAWVFWLYPGCIWRFFSENCFGRNRVKKLLRSWTAYYTPKEIGGYRGKPA